MWVAIGLTILSYAIMTGYDALALRYIRHQLAYSKIGFASFIGYAFSNNIGLSMIVGASVRYRLYSAWGLSTLQITQVVAFCTLTLWLGFFTLGGAVFLIEPLALQAAIHLPLTSVSAIGIFILAVVLAYGIVTVAKKAPITIREWETQLPSIGLFVSQLILIIFGCSVWLGFYSYRHIEYADSLWWRFAFTADASRFLRATVGVVVCGLFFAAARLLRPAVPQPTESGRQELEKAYSIGRQLYGQFRQFSD